MTEARGSGRSKKVFFQIALYAILTFLVFCQVFPFYLQIVSAFQPLDLIPVEGRVYLLPVSWNFGNFAEAVKRVELFEGLKNSLLVTVGYTALSSFVILDTGYVLGKKQFKGKNAVKFCMLLTMAVPGEMLLVSNYLLVSNLGWTNSFAGLILPGIVNITGIFLVTSFMNTIPESVLESARIDGARELRRIFSIVLPLSMPIMATYWILTFVAQWNEYLWPLIIVSDRSMFTVQLKLKEFNPYYFGFADEVLIAAAHILTLVPVILLYAVCQKKFVGGISVTGMK